MWMEWKIVSYFEHEIFQKRRDWNDLLEIIRKINEIRKNHIFEKSTRIWERFANKYRSRIGWRIKELSVRL